MLDILFVDYNGLKRPAGVDGLTAGQRLRWQGTALAKRRDEYLYSRLLLNSLWRGRGFEPPAGELPPNAPHPPVETERGLLYTSLTHSAGCALAVLADAPVAVDIELVKPRDFEALARHALAKEADAILASPDRALAFYKAWCRREALYKLAGAAPVFEHASLIAASAGNLAFHLVCAKAQQVRVRHAEF